MQSTCDSRVVHLLLEYCQTIETRVRARLDIRTEHLAQGARSASEVLSCWRDKVRSLRFSPCYHALTLKSIIRVRSVSTWLGEARRLKMLVSCFAFGKTPRGPHCARQARQCLARKYVRVAELPDVRRCLARYREGRSAQRGY